MSRVILAALLLAVTGPAAGKTVTLTLLNADSEVLRCHPQLAHFVSLPAKEAAPGDALQWDWSLDAAQGALFMARDDGRRMDLEFLLCGRAIAWQETWAPVPLAGSDLGGGALRFSCRLEGRMTCRRASP